MDKLRERGDLAILRKWGHGYIGGKVGMAILRERGDMDILRERANIAILRERWAWLY